MRCSVNGLLLWIGIPALLAAGVTDKPLETAKQVHEAAIEKAEADLQKAQQKFNHDKAEADARLIKAYDDAIKRTTQRGDLESANALLAERKALEGDATAAPIDGQIPDSAASKLTWKPMAKDGVTPALIIVDADNTYPDSDYVTFLGQASKGNKCHDRSVAVTVPRADGLFLGPGPKNIETNYYAFYIRTALPQTVNLSLATNEFGHLKVYVDGDQVFEHAADKQNKYETKVPLELKRGNHIVVIRHYSEWAGNVLTVHFDGKDLQVPK